MAAESEFSKEIRKVLLNEYDLIRIETKEEDGFPDLFGRRLSDDSGVAIELKSHKVTKKGTVDLRLAPSQKIRLQWLSRFMKVCVLCEINVNEVLVIAIGPPVVWNRLLTGSPAIKDILEYDSRNTVIHKLDLLEHLRHIFNKPI